MCFCPEEMDHNSVHAAVNATVAVLNSSAQILSNSTMVTSTIVHAAGSVVGPQFARQVMKKFNNFTVVDKVPPEMMHLVGEHWYGKLSLGRKNFFNTYSFYKNRN